MASLTIPGIFISKATFALSTTSAQVTLGSMTTTARRKANAVLIVYNGTIDVWVNIDGTTAAVGFGFLMNGVTTVPTAPSTATNPVQQLLVYGLPTVTAIAASGTPSVEVYLLNIPGLTI